MSVERHFRIQFTPCLGFFPCKGKCMLRTFFPSNELHFRHNFFEIYFIGGLSFMFIKCFLYCLNPRYIHPSRKIHFSFFALKRIKITKQLKMKEKVCNKNINTAIHKWRCLKLSSKVCNASKGFPEVVALYIQSCPWTKQSS